MPTYLAWDAFGKKNGTDSLDELNSRVINYRKRDDLSVFPKIGCIILYDPFYFKENDWIPAPANWANSIVRGKTYSTEDDIGFRLYAQVQERLQKYPTVGKNIRRDPNGLFEQRNLEAGTFTIAVMDAYHRQCAVTGDMTLPVLESSYIKPLALDGPQTLQNGVLLRSDIHRLFDRGYLTITPDHRVEVSRHLITDFGNQGTYLSLNGANMANLPEQLRDYPDKGLIEWHNEHIYLG